MKKNGFVVMSALFLAGLTFLSAIFAFVLKRSVDNDIAQMVAKHSIYLAEDTIKTNIQLMIADLNDLVKIQQMIVDLKDFKVPVAGSVCDNAMNPCYMRVKRDTFSNPLITFREEPVGSGDQFAIIVLTYDGNSLPKAKTLVNDITIRILLPKVTTLAATVPTNATTEATCLATANPWDNQRCANYMKNNFCLNNPSHDKCTNLNPLMCTHSAPIFRGTKFDSQGIERAICNPIPGNNIRNTQSPIETVTCDVQGGMWLSNVGDDLSLNCVRFPAGIQTQQELTLCNDPNQIAKTYELDGDLNVSNLKCVNRGGAYDFTSQSGTWN